MTGSSMDVYVDVTGREDQVREVKALSSARSLLSIARTHRLNYTLFENNDWSLDNLYRSE
jgi:hypothetical protein